MKRLFYISLSALLILACSPAAKLTTVQTLSPTSASPILPTTTLPTPILPKVSTELTPKVYGNPVITTTAQYSRFPDMQPQVTGLVADLQVSPDKITYFMVPSKAVAEGGVENVIKTAVSEALVANGNGDVLVSLNCQIKYDKNGRAESITVMGYPATYVNFRTLYGSPMSAEPEVTQIDKVEVVETDK